VAPGAGEGAAEERLHKMAEEHEEIAWTMERERREQQQTK